MKLRRLFGVWIVPVLAMCGCQSDPFADWFLRRNVAESALTGSYHITRGTLQHFASQRLAVLHGEQLRLSPDARVVLQTDHKIYLSNVPFDAGDDICAFGDANAAGTWKIGKHQKYTAVRVSLTNLHALHGCPQGEYGFDMELFDDSILHIHSTHKYPLLHLTIGDPDSGDAMQFERDKRD